MSKLGAKKIIKLLEEIVEVKGADTIADCKYLDPDAVGKVRPLCIAGHAIYQIAGKKGLKGLTEHHAIGRIRMLGDDEYTCGPNDAYAEQYMTPRAVRVLRLAQFYQDEGNNWGDSLAAAKEYERTRKLPSGAPIG